MSSYAHTILIGHLGKDPVFDEKNEVARFSVAVTRKRKAGDLTTWWNVTAWRGAGKIAAQYLKKGSQVSVSGTPYLEEYQKDGVTKQALKLDANDITLLGKADSTAPAPTPTRRAPAPADAGDDEPPF